MGGLCIAAAGPFAPISILLVVMLLYLFRAVYTEVVTALPLNGGAYNALLNTTSKLVAALGGTLTVLSYTATAVVSADSAAQYFASLVPQVALPAVIIIVVGGCLRGLVAGPHVLASRDHSGRVRGAESAGHHRVQRGGHDHLRAALRRADGADAGIAGVPVPDGLALVRGQLAVGHHHALWLGGPVHRLRCGVRSRSVCARSSGRVAGFGSAMVGVSGFESSANYVEEQEVGVFRKVWLRAALRRGVRRATHRHRRRCATCGWWWGSSTPCCACWVRSFGVAPVGGSLTAAPRSHWHGGRA